MDWSAWPRTGPPGLGLVRLAWATVVPGPAQLLSNTAAAVESETLREEVVQLELAVYLLTRSLVCGGEVVEWDVRRRLT